jgi:hypothetical protein
LSKFKIAIDCNKEYRDEYRNILNSYEIFYFFLINILQQARKDGFAKPSDILKAHFEKK